MHSLRHAVLGTHAEPRAWCHVSHVLGAHLSWALRAAPLQHFSGCACACLATSHMQRAQSDLINAGTCPASSPALGLESSSSAALPWLRLCLPAEPARREAGYLKLWSALQWLEPSSHAASHMQCQA